MRRHFLRTDLVTIHTGNGGPDHRGLPGITLDTALSRLPSEHLRRLVLVPVNEEIEIAGGPAGTDGPIPRHGLVLIVNQAESLALRFWSAEPNQLAVLQCGEEETSEPPKVRQSCYADHVSDPHHSPALPATPATAPARLGE